MLAAVLGLVVGAVVGGLGGGGGVLTVPVLVYLLGQSVQDATTGSVLIVGVTAAAGVLARLRGGIDHRVGLPFAAVGVPVAWAGTLANRSVSPSVLLIAFAVLTLLAAGAMLLDARGGSAAPGSVPESSGEAGRAAAVRTRMGVGVVVKVVVAGAAVGFLTGFLGVGGGFLVVPVLVLALRMPMSLAIGTSLMVILVNSAAAFAFRLGDLHPDWAVIAPFACAAVVGSYLGKRVADRLSGRVLTRAFAVLLGAVGVFVGVQAVLGG